MNKFLQKAGLNMI